MTGYEYDPDLPYVVESRHTRGLIARFAARNYIDDALSPEGVRIIDTTPKPRIPDNAEYITWVGCDGRRRAARYWGGEQKRWHAFGYDASTILEDLPGVTPDTVFTVLEERKS